MANEITILGEVNGFTVQFTLDTVDLMQDYESGDPDQSMKQMLGFQLQWALNATKWLQGNGVEPAKQASGVGGWSGRAKKQRITVEGDKWRVDVPAVFNNRQFDKDATNERRKAIKALPHDIHKETYTKKDGSEGYNLLYDVPQTAFVAQELIKHYGDLEGIEIVKVWLENNDEPAQAPDKVVPLHKRDKQLHVTLMTTWETAFGKNSDDYRHGSVKTFTRGKTTSTQELSDQQVNDFLAILDVVIAAQNVWGTDMMTLPNGKEVETWKYELIIQLRNHFQMSDVWALLSDQSRAMKAIINKLANEDAIA